MIAASLRAAALVVLSGTAACASNGTEPASVVDRSGDSSVVDPGPTVDSLPPLYEDAPPVRPLLDAREYELPNGLRLLLREDHEVPLLSIHVRVDGGALVDPQHHEGRAALLGDLLTRGAGERDAEAFREAVDFVGGRLSVWTGIRQLGVDAEFLARDRDLAIALVADLLMRARLSAEEFERARGLRIDGLRSARSEPQRVIETYFRRLVLGDSLLGRPVGGDEHSLAALEHADMRSAAADLLRPDRTTIAVAGAFDTEELRFALAKAFEGWVAVGPPPTVEATVPERSDGPTVLVVEKPDALQTYFRAGAPSIAWGDDDYPARFLANTVLGGRFTSRLNTALRIESGLSYGAGSEFDDARAGLFALRSFTATATSMDAVLLARDVYEEFRRDGLRDGELESARAYILGQYPLDELETASQRLTLRLDLERDGLPPDVVDGLFRRLWELDRDSVDRVIRERFPETLDWVLVGRPDAILPFAPELGAVRRVRISTPGFGDFQDE